MENSSSRRPRARRLVRQRLADLHVESGARQRRGIRGLAAERRTAAIHQADVGRGPRDVGLECGGHVVQVFQIRVAERTAPRAGHRAARVPRQPIGADARVLDLARGSSATTFPQRRRPSPPDRRRRRVATKYCPRALVAGHAKQRRHLIGGALAESAHVNGRAPRRRCRTPAPARSRRGVPLRPATCRAPRAGRTSARPAARALPSRRRQELVGPRRDHPPRGARPHVRPLEQLQRESAVRAEQFRLGQIIEPLGAHAIVDFKTWRDAPVVLSRKHPRRFEPRPRRR